MSNKRRAHGDGSIDTRGEDSHRLRYRVNGKRFTKTLRGSLTDARKELRQLLKSGDDGVHVAPGKVTLEQWVKQWIAAGAPGQRRKQVGRRSVERYEQLLRCYVLPELGSERLQHLQPAKIDALYQGLDGAAAPRTIHHVHVVLNACLGTAVRKGLMQANPIVRAEKIPSPGETDHGIALDEDELRTLMDGFRKSSLFRIVATTAFTGARRGEILALRWSEVDLDAKTIRIERAIEVTKKHELTIKARKTSAAGGRLRSMRN